MMTLNPIKLTMDTNHHSDKAALSPELDQLFSQATLAWKDWLLPGCGCSLAEYESPGESMQLGFEGLWLEAFLVQASGLFLWHFLM